VEDRKYVSPDGQLCLLVISPDGDLTIGFDGAPAHTHGSILAELSGLDEESAAEQFIAGIIESRKVIAIWRAAGEIREIWIPEHNYQSLQDVILNLEPGETVEFRLWNGTKIDAPAD
jgi:hypothetical protein